MSVLRRAKLRTPDGTESIEYPLGVEAENVEVANQENLSQRLVRIDEDLEKNEEDIAAVSELAERNRQNIGANEIRIDALERRNASVDKKPYYYNTVADMKADIKLKVGDMAITLGYYSINDGGAAKYNIINNNTYNNNYCEELNNNLLAELIIDNTMHKLVFDLITNSINGFLNANNHNILPDVNQSNMYFNNAHIYNAIICFDSISTKTEEEDYNYYNSHAIFNGDIVFENCIITHIRPTKLNFINDVNIKFINCKFMNTYLHFSSNTLNNESTGPRKIFIENCIFDLTIPNSPSTVGSCEYIHVTNSANILEGCYIGKNVFKNSYNDCVDVYPTGSNLIIDGNTFINCENQILELKLQKQYEGVIQNKGVIVTNNFFRKIPSSTQCIKCFYRDEMSTDDTSLSPVILFNNNIFVNDDGNTGISAFQFTTNIKSQICNCKTVDFDGENITNRFIQITENIQLQVDNCCTNAYWFIDSAQDNNNNNIAVNNCDASSTVATTNVGRIRNLANLKINNSRILSITNSNSTSQAYINNCEFLTRLQWGAGLYLINNSYLKGISNNVSVEDTTSYMSVNNCFTTGSITESNNLIKSNVKTIS